jgi:PAS domain S-box-containing protein
MKGEDKPKEQLKILKRSLAERVKELECLYGISEIVERPQITLTEIYQGVVDLLPSGWQYPEVACARLAIEGREFKTANYGRTPWAHSADIKVYGVTAGLISVGYLEERPAGDEGPFLKEERQLINAVAERLGRIIERIRAEKTAAYLASFPEMNSSPVLELDREGNLKYVNPAAKRIFPGLEDLGTNHPFLSDWEGVVKELKDSNWTKPITREAAAGGLVYQQTLHPMAENRIRIYGIDITQRKQVEEELANSEVRYRRLFETAQDAILILNGDDGKIIDANPFIKDLLGYSLEELLGKNLWEIGELKDTLASKISYRQLHDSGYVRYDHLPLVTKDGRKIAVEVVANAYQVDHLKVIQCNIRDVTERKKAEDDLEKREEFLNNIIEKTPNAIFVTDEKGTLIRMNQALSDLLKIQDEEIIGQYNVLKDTQVIEQGFLPLVKSVFEEGRTVSFILNYDTEKEKQVTLAATCRKVLELVISAIKDEEGRVIHAIGQEKDITEQILVEEENRKLIASIQQEKDRLLTLVNSIPDEVWFADTQKNITLANPSALQEFGYTKASGINVEALATGLEVYRPDGTPRPLEEAPPLRALRGETIKNQEEIVRTPFRGELRYRQVSAAPVKDIKGDIIGSVSVARDITERRKAEKQRELSLKILQLLHKSGEKKELICKLLELFKSDGQFEAVGIRLRDGDDFPYYETDGFSDEHIRSEARLCTVDGKGGFLLDMRGNPVLECMCGNIILGRFDPAKPFFTEGGSFWTNSTTDMLAATTEADRQARTRNRCNGEGYESVALIPIKALDTVIGLLQINDARRNRFSLEMIKYYEGVAQSIGIALMQKQMEESLLASEARYRDLYKNAPIAYFSMGTDGLIKESNKAAQLLLGYSEEELIGKPRLEIYAPECAAEARTVIKKVNRGLSIENQEMIYRRKDGVKVYGLLSATPILDERGHVVTVRSVVKDITENKKAEQALRQSEMSLRQEKEFALNMINTAQVIILTLDKEGRILTFNPYLEGISGYRLEKMRGKDWFDTFIPERDRDGTRKLFKQAIGGIQTRGDVNSIVTKDGRERDIEWYDKTLKDMNGNIVGLLCIGHDITERRQAENKLADERKRLEIVTRNIGVGLALISKDFTTIWANDVLKSLFGETEGKPCYLTYNKQPDICPWCGVRSVFQNNEDRVETEAHGFDINGNEVWSQIIATAIRNEKGEIIYALEAVIPITERKKAEAKALEMEALKRTNQAKSELLANVSHELRTPLASIKGFIETLIETDVKWNEEQKVEFLQSANKEADRLAFLIRDLLDMSRIDSGKLALDKRSYLVSEILDSVSGVLSVITAGHRLKIKPAPDLPPMLVDKVRIGQVITNLVENAAKFSAEGSPILIEVKAVNDSVIFSVEDQGEGISQEAAGQLFNRFYQAERVVSGKTRGTGLGLAICKGIVESHGGKIWVESRPGKGSRFSFSFPVNK